MRLIGSAKFSSPGQTVPRMSVALMLLFWEQGAFENEEIGNAMGISYSGGSKSVSAIMNTELARKLGEMAERDQQLLQELFEIGELPSEKYHPQMRALHESNTSALKKIIKKYGWPGISLVGADGAESAWLIAQHAVSDTKFMSDCIELLNIAIAAGDVEGWQLAFLEDRVRTMSGKDQLYGTQFDVDKEGWPISFPIAEPETVNERRKALGLNSLEERLERMRERERQRRAQQSARKALQRTSR